MLSNVIAVDQAQPWSGFLSGKNLTAAKKAPESDTNAELAHCIKAIAEQRDRQAFTRLFHLMAPRIKAYCLKSGSDAATAEEMAQETMIQVWRRAAQFDPTRASVTTWIFTITRNKRIDHFRKEKRPEITADDIAQSMSDPVNADQKMETTQTAEALAEKIQALSSEQAEVIHKAFFEDKTHQVIASELDIPLGTVKSRIRLALTKLQISMAEYER